MQHTHSIFHLSMNTLTDAFRLPHIYCMKKTAVPARARANDILVPRHIVSGAYSSYCRVVVEALSRLVPERRTDVSRKKSPGRRLRWIRLCLCRQYSLRYGLLMIKRRNRMVFLRPFLLLLPFIAAAVDGDLASRFVSLPDQGFEKLVAWMKQHGGQVDSRIDVGVTNGIRGIVATDDIEDGAQLLFCPWKLIIGSTGINDQMHGQDDMCKVVQDMASEIRLGGDSLWCPYLNHIELPRLAAMWGHSAMDELQGLPPSQSADRHIQWFQQSCEGELDDVAMQSLVAFISRANEVGMNPIYDLLNHHNGKRNAKLSTMEEGVQLLVVGGPVEKGQELFLSYGIKTASTMYRDYGFVEDWPTCWNFQDKASGDNFAFVHFPDGVAAINPTGDFLKQIWHSNASVEEYQANAKKHVESLPLGDIDRFSLVARKHLNDFPTTLQEDLSILVQRRASLAMQKLEMGDVSGAEDVISATEYRIEFKRALNEALVYAEAAGDASRENIGRREL